MSQDGEGIKTSSSRSTGYDNLSDLSRLIDKTFQIILVIDLFFEQSCIIL